MIEGKTAPTACRIFWVAAQQLRFGVRCRHPCYYFDFVFTLRGRRGKSNAVLVFFEVGEETRVLLLFCDNEGMAFWVSESAVKWLFTAT